MGEGGGALCSVSLNMGKFKTPAQISTGSGIYKHTLYIYIYNIYKVGFDSIKAFWILTPSEGVKNGKLLLVFLKNFC